LIGPALVAHLSFPVPRTVVSADAAHAIVEGVASDGRMLWLSSVLDRNILVCVKSCRTLAVLPAGKHPLGIAWDKERKLLWVTADCPDLPGIAKCERGSLLALDRQGGIRVAYQPATGNFHPGDVSVSSAGTFVSDSQNGALYRVTGRHLATIVAPGTGRSAQGSALTTDKRTLLVADYSQGIATINLATRKRTLVGDESGRPLRGIDGMIRCGRSYYAIHNGSAPASLVKLSFDGATIRAEQLVTGEPLSDPTQLASDGKRLLLVANSGWATIGKPRLAPATIVAVPLPSCR
jgi:hypothetical protein